MPVEEEPAACIGYGNTCAYVAVPTSLSDTIVNEGYKANLRQEVPCAFSPSTALQAFTSHYPHIEDVTVLEVVDIPASMIDKKRCKIKKKHLEAKHFRTGAFYEQTSCYEAEPCPFCDRLIPDEAGDRGHVGLRRYFKQAFMVVPCCYDAGVARQHRLDNGEKLLLYHQTTKEIAKLIWDAGGKMIRGSKGIAGAGIYFASSARETEWKCETKDPSRRVVLKCRVLMGRVKEVDRDADRTLSFAALARQSFDSVLVRRGVCKVPGPGYGKPSGDEIVVYSWDQVEVLDEVPRDPVPR